MKLISQITVRVRPGGLSGLIEDIHKYRCSVQKLTCLETADDREVHSVELVYENRALFNELLHSGGKKYKIDEETNVLEETIRGGLLNCQCKIPLETLNDYQISLLGATELMREKIIEGAGDAFTGASRAVGIFSGMKAENEDAPERRRRLYIQSELDAVLINRFSDLNGFPAVIDFQQPEDLIKTIQRIEHSFVAIRLISIDESDLSLYQQIRNDVAVPVISTEMDIIPVYLLTLILKIFKKNKINPGETAIGLLGVDVSAIRLTQLLIKLGCQRVLGYDHNEKNLLSFEHNEGLATTADNIFTNADLVVLLKDNFTREEFQKARPGQFIVSLIGEDLYDRDYITGRGVREYIAADTFEMHTLIPGILRGTIESGNSAFDDSRMIEFCRKLVNVMHDEYSVPDVFSDIHAIVADLINPALPHRA
jgi:malate dehydrogenase (oxaloacetate-decarboxylating)